MSSQDKEFERLINERQKHKGQWLALENVIYYQNLAQKISGDNIQDIGKRRKLRKELQKKFGILEIEAVNILNGFHGDFYVEKYRCIRDGIPMRKEPPASHEKL